MKLILFNKTDDKLSNCIDNIDRVLGTSPIMWYYSIVEIFGGH